MQKKIILGLILIFVSIGTFVLFRKEEAPQESTQIERFERHYVKKQYEFANDWEPAEIVMLGNSITAYGDWKKLLHRNDIANRGIAGDLSGLLANRLNNVIRLKPKFCFLLIGINDIYIGENVESIQNNIKRSVEILEPYPIKMVLQSVIYVAENASRFESVNNDVRKLNEWMKSYCLKNELEFLDLNTTLGNTDVLLQENTVDGIHLSKIGYKKWSGLLKSFLKENSSATN